MASQKTNSKNDFSGYGYTSIILGLAFTILGYLSGIIPETYLEWQLSIKGQLTQGKVVSRHIKKTETTISYFITYQFIAEEKGMIPRSIDVEEQINPDTYKALSNGDSVDVWYVMGRPKESTIEREPNNYLGFALWFFLTTGLFIFGAFLLRHLALHSVLITLGGFISIYGILGLIMALFGNAAEFQKEFNLISVLGEAVGSLWMGSILSIFVGVSMIMLGLVLAKKKQDRYLLPYEK